MGEGFSTGEMGEGFSVEGRWGEPGGAAFPASCQKHFQIMPPAFAYPSLLLPCMHLSSHHCRMTITGCPGNLPNCPPLLRQVPLHAPARCQRQAGLHHP